MSDDELTPAQRFLRDHEGLPRLTLFGGESSPDWNVQPIPAAPFHGAFPVRLSLAEGDQ